MEADSSCSGHSSTSFFSVMEAAWKSKGEVALGWWCCRPARSFETPPPSARPPPGSSGRAVGARSEVGCFDRLSTNDGDQGEGHSHRPCARDRLPHPRSLRGVARFSAPVWSSLRMTGRGALSPRSVPRKAGRPSRRRHPPDPSPPLSSARTEGEAGCFNRLPPEAGRQHERCGAGGAQASGGLGGAPLHSGVVAPSGAATLSGDRRGRGTRDCRSGDCRRITSDGGALPASRVPRPYEICFVTSCLQTPRCSFLLPPSLQVRLT